MPSSAVNICVLTLVLLSFQRTCHGRPHRSKRGLVKDYFVPDSLLFSSDKFEKGEDGKYYLKKSSHRSDSEVKYSSPEDEKNSLENNMKSVELEAVIDKSENVPTESTKNEPLKEEVIKASDVAPPPAIVEETKVTEIESTPKVESVVEEVEVESEKAPFAPVDPKIEMQPKPDSKDEISMKTHLPPIDVEEKVDEKITIGQVPDLYSRLMPVPGNFRVPILIPLRQVTYGAMKVTPISPAEMSDRLPLPYEDDIIGEGAHESESEGVSEPITEEKKDGGHSLGNPLTTGVHLPALSIGTFLKDIKEADKRNSEKQSKVVDVLGKKFLMQSNVMKYPTGDNSHVYLRLLSVKPLEEPKPIAPKEALAKEESGKDLEKEEEEIVAEEVVTKEKSVIESEIEKEKSLIETEVEKEELLKEPEVLKAEETKIKVNVEQEVPKEVVLRNMGKSVNDATDEIKIHSIHSVIEAAELNPLRKTEEKVVASEKETKSEVEEMKPESLLKDEPVNEEIVEESEKGAMEEEKVISEETKEKVDTLLIKEDAKKETEISSKKDFFFVEKKKKGKFMEESEKVKSSKKMNKKKKCKCEEKDSDSEDDDE